MAEDYSAQNMMNTRIELQLETREQPGCVMNSHTKKHAKKYMLIFQYWILYNEFWVNKPHPTAIMSIMQKTNRGWEYTTPLPKKYMQYLQNSSRSKLQIVCPTSATSQTVLCLRQPWPVFGWIQVSSPPCPSPLLQPAPPPVQACSYHQAFPPSCSSDWSSGQSRSCFDVAFVLQPAN